MSQALILGMLGSSLLQGDGPGEVLQRFARVVSSAGENPTLSTALKPMLSKALAGVNLDDPVIRGVIAQVANVDVKSLPPGSDPLAFVTSLSQGMTSRPIPDDHLYCQCPHCGSAFSRTVSYQ